MHPSYLDDFVHHNFDDFDRWAGRSQNMRLNSGENWRSQKQTLRLGFTAQGSFLRPQGAQTHLSGKLHALQCVQLVPLACK